MDISCLDIQKKALEILKADPVLGEYVAVFSIGEENVSRMTFPYIAVTEVTVNTAPLCIGANAPNMNNYKIVVQGGTRHTLPEIARAGDESHGLKGIVQLTDDIVAALYPNSIDGLFKPTVHLMNATKSAVDKSRGGVWNATIVFSGRIKA